MIIIKLKILFILALLLFTFQTKAYSQTDKNLFYQGLKAARKGEQDFAFMHFNKILNDFPQSNTTNKHYLQ